jgi:hypothetical protein
MRCLTCGSENQIVVHAEVAFSFTGCRAVLKNPPVHVVQKPRVCLDCGFVALPIPQGELQRLREGSGALERL